MAEGGYATSTAETFVKARRAARALVGFPGDPPTEMEAAYAVQKAAIAAWPDEIAGWKVGRVPAAFEARLGQSRLAGPIFRKAIRWAEPGVEVRFPVFVGGFAAVEAEVVYVIGKDAPTDKLAWSVEEAAELIETIRIGVEIAGSPLATINKLGPTVVACDFGNNAGLILGAPLGGAESELACETFIDGVSVGGGGPANILGGPIGSLRFLAEHCARRGRPLRRGQVVSTGAMTGIHDIRPGQSARVSFGGSGEIVCTAEAARPNGEA